MPRIEPDLTRHILYTDPETGEEVKGGEDSPYANALREELNEKYKARVRRILRGDDADQSEAAQETGKSSDVF
jgi:hypothetical protein